MKIFRFIVALLAFLASGVCQAQSMFRGNPAHTGVYAGPAPGSFTGSNGNFLPAMDRLIASPGATVFVYFGGDDGNIYAVATETGRQIWKQSHGRAVQP